MRKKAVLASILSAMLVLPTNGVNALANSDTTNSEFTATADMLGGDLLVTIPDSIDLTKSGDKFVGSGKVTAQGKVSPSTILSVETNPEVTYKNQYKTDITAKASVSFGTNCKASWNATELKNNITASPKQGYNVKAEVPFSDIKYIGSYKTNILFNISLSDSGTQSSPVTYYMGYKYTDSTKVSYANQNDIAYEILPQTDTVAELKEFSTDKAEIQSKGYDKVIEASDKALEIPDTLDGKDVVGVSFDTFFGNDDIATYVDTVDVPSSVTGVELSDTTSSQSSTIITCDNIRSTVNLSKKLPSTAKIRFKFEAKGEKDYSKFFAYDSNSSGEYVIGFSQYGYDMLKSYGSDATIEITMPRTSTRGKELTTLSSSLSGNVSGKYYSFSEVLSDENTPNQVWVFPETYKTCKGLWATSTGDKSSGVKKLKGVIFNEGMQTIYQDAFKYCTGLEEVRIPASVTDLQSCAFRNCTNLKKVTFADGFNGFDGSDTDASYCVFMNDSALKEVTIPESVTKFNATVFGNSADNTYIKFINWSINHDAITVGNANTLNKLGVISRYADGNYIGVGDTAVKQTATSADGINASISSDIADNQFNNYEGLAYKNITINSGVKSIGEKAFWYCTAEKITIPDSVTTIGDSAFGNTSANFGEFDLRNVTSLGRSAFYKGKFDKLITSTAQLKSTKAINNTVIKDLYIEYTDSSALASNSYPTDGCTITNVHFTGTEEQWASFLGSGASKNPALVNANIEYNSILP